MRPLAVCVAYMGRGRYRIRALEENYIYPGPPLTSPPLLQEVVRLETEYWQLLDIPRQEKQEPVLTYVLRACAIVEKSQRSQEQAEKAHRADEDEERKRENAQRLNGMTTSQILEENTMLTNELYRQLRKYSSLRTLMRELKDDYVESKMYPIIPRYFMLKEMIHDVMRDPAFVEICHEVTQGPPPPAT
ncbi:uncharacterized protein [Penaeus vannamei]|uniref:uncharacterized protein n=1 Tax=Penaeus vannamei TaxID=6689 RepID=UPI00387FA700